jgi:outer membrane protein
MAKSSSIAAKQAVTIKETKYWEWRNFRSNYQPQLSLKVFYQVILKLIHKYNNLMVLYYFSQYIMIIRRLTLNFSQSIAATGGTIYGTTQLQTF